MYKISTRKGVNVLGTKKFKTIREANKAKAKLIRESKSLDGAVAYLSFPIRKVAVKKRKR